MTTISLAALLLLTLLVAVKHHKRVWNLLSEIQKSKFRHESVKSPADIQRMAPYPAQPIRGRERYRVMMDIRKLDSQNWLTLDKNYMEEHRVRDHLLREKKGKVLQCLPESVEACREALEEVSSFLCQRFPSMFQTEIVDGRQSIQNRMTGEKFEIGGAFPNEKPTDALEAAVRLTMEDLSILMKNDEDEYYLCVSTPVEDLRLV